MGYTNKIEAVRLSILFKGHRLTLSVDASSSVVARRTRTQRCRTHTHTFCRDPALPHTKCRHTHARPDAHARKHSSPAEAREAQGRVTLGRGRVLTAPRAPRRIYDTVRTGKLRVRTRIDAARPWSNRKVRVCGGNQPKAAAHRPQALNSQPAFCSISTAFR